MSAAAFKSCRKQSSLCGVCKKLGLSARDNPNFTAPTKRCYTDEGVTKIVPYFFIAYYH